MKTLNFTVNSSGFVSMPVTSFSEDMDCVTGEFMKVCYDSLAGTYIRVENPTIRWNGINLKVTFIPGYEYRKKRFFKRYNEIVKYPDVKIKVRISKNTLHISYTTIIGSVKVEGKFVISKRGENQSLIISHENLPYNIKIQVKF